MSAPFHILRPFLKQLFFSFAVTVSCAVPVLGGGVSITNYGHSALLIKGGGKSVLLNPFMAVGCATGLTEPRIKVDVVLASSELADEGARIAKGTFLVEPGSYRVGGVNFEGLSLPHDRIGGRRFGLATLWKWKQGGLNFAHLGGSASPLNTEEKILLGRPDVLIIAVGGGAKVYDGIEAARIVGELNPKRIIPVQYVIGKPPKNCDQKGVESFLEAMQGIEVKEVGKTYLLPSSIPNGTQIHIMQ